VLGAHGSHRGTTAELVITAVVFVERFVFAPELALCPWLVASVPTVVARRETSLTTTRATKSKASDFMVRIEATLTTMWMRLVSTLSSAVDGGYRRTFTTRVNTSIGAWFPRHGVVTV